MQCSAVQFNRTQSRLIQFKCSRQSSYECVTCTVGRGWSGGEGHVCLCCYHYFRSPLCLLLSLYFMNTIVLLIYYENCYCQLIVMITTWFDCPAQTCCRGSEHSRCQVTHPPYSHPLYACAFYYWSCAFDSMLLTAVLYWLQYRIDKAIRTFYCACY